MTWAVTWCRQRLSRLPALAAVWLAVCLSAPPPCQAQTTASVFLPAYRATEWSFLRGSIVASNGDEKTYTIFCAEQTPDSCDITGDVPFTFAEGPSTLHSSGTLSGSYTGEFHCVLAGKTAATCTGATTLGSGYIQGRITGPTQTRWTRTWSGPLDVQWAALTLAAAPTSADPLETGIDGTAMSTSAAGAGTQPTPTVTTTATTTSASGPTDSSIVNITQPSAAGRSPVVAEKGAVVFWAMGLALVLVLL